MRSALFLLALIVGTVLGGEINVKVTGYTDPDEYLPGEKWPDENMPCDADALEYLYGECVVNTALKLGASFDRRLGLRGGRDLAVCDVCPYAASTLRGHWCYYRCGVGRRLTLANEHPNGPLPDHGQIRRLTDTNVDVDGGVSLGEVNHCRFTAAATKCYQKKAKQEYQCLGNPGDLKVQVRFYE